MADITTYLSTLGPIQMIGVAGFVTYIMAFGSLQFGLMDGNGIGYSIANIIAAGLVAISLMAEFNLASALIQGSWIVIGVIGLVLRLVKASVARRPHFQNNPQIGARS